MNKLKIFDRIDLKLNSTALSNQKQPADITL